MRLAYRPDIQYLRALAVLSVLIYHFFPKTLPGGFIGVDIFFVISGFLITRIILFDGPVDAFSLGEFYRRRIRRIFPALLLVMIFILTTGWFLLFANEYEQVGRHTIASSLFLQNLMLYSESGYFDPAAELKPLLHLWSLSVEEQFYLLWPLILIMGMRRGLPPFLLVFPLFLGSFAFNLWIRHSNPAGDFYGPFSRFWELLLGALVLFLPEGSRLFSRHWVRAVSIGLGVALIGIGLTFINSRMGFPGFWALLPTMGTALVIASSANLSRSPSAKSLKAIAYIGRISYPLYLWHWPLFSLSHILHQGTPPWVLKAALIMASFGLAIFTHHGLERPIQRSQGWLIPGGFALAMALILGFGASILYFGGYPERAIEAHNPQRSPRPIEGYASLALDCNSLGASALLSPHCRLFKPTAYTQTIVIWGDSSAIAWTPVFLEIARRQNLQLLVIGHASCPPLLSARKTHFDLPESAHYCHDGQLQWDVLQMITKIQPDLIVYMGALGGYRTNAGVPREDTEFMTDQSGEEAQRESNRQTLIRRLPETLSRLTEISPVLALKTWPLLPANLPPPPHATLQNLLIRGFKPSFYSRSYFDAQRELVDALLENQRSDRLELFDPAAALCDAEVCANALDGILAYSDRYHITPLAALRYEKPLTALIEQRLNRQP